MEIGMFTSGYQRQNIEVAFKDARALGYDYIELWGGRPHAFPYDLEKGDLEVILSLQEKYQMPVKVYTPEHNAYPYNYMIGSESQRQSAIAYLKTAILMGTKLGAEYTVISAGHAALESSSEEKWERLLNTLKELVAYAEEVGQILLLEALTPYESNVVTNLDDLVRATSAIHSPYFGVMLDFVPPVVQNENIMDYFKVLGDKIMHLHSVDSDGKSDTHLIPGDGIIPFKEIMADIEASGYTGSATIELVTHYIDEPSKAAERALRQLNEMRRE